MRKKGDTSAGITPFHTHHVVAGIHIGTYTCMVPASIHDILSLGAQARHVEDGVRHHHIPVPYISMPSHDLLMAATTEVVNCVQENRPILIRSEGGRQRPGLISALAIMHIGGTYYDALSCVKSADLDALTDFRYTDLLKSYELEYRGITKAKP